MTELELFENSGKTHENLSLVEDNCDKETIGKKTFFF